MPATTPATSRAIKRLARIEQQRINESGGIAGRKLHVEFLDDQRDDQRAVGNVHSAFSDPDTIAVIGLSNPKRAKAAFDSLAREINDTRIPFLSDISINSLFAKYPQRLHDAPLAGRRAPAGAHPVRAASRELRRRPSSASRTICSAPRSPTG